MKIKGENIARTPRIVLNVNEVPKISEQPRHIIQTINPKGTKTIKVLIVAPMSSITITSQNFSFLIFNLLTQTPTDKCRKQSLQESIHLESIRLL